MVANLSSHKRGWDERWEEFSGEAGGQRKKDKLLDLVDEDTIAFERVMTALGMPKGGVRRRHARLHWRRRISGRCKCRFR
jgi:glutamate formiminotransferase/formiminotetrahydrofolate cyclodeaminase